MINRTLFTRCRTLPWTVGHLALLAVAAASVSAQVFTYDGEGGANILEGGGSFSGASGQTLNVGRPGNYSLSYNAIVQGLNSQVRVEAPSAEVNVYGESSLTFLGKTIGKDDTRQSIFNFQDQSTFLLDAGTRGHALGGDVVINYNSRAHSSSLNVGLMFSRDKAEAFTTLNINAGSIQVGGLNFNRQKTRINLAGGDLITKKLSIRFNDDQGYNAKINFDSSTGSKFEIGQDGLAKLQDGVAHGLFQIDGIVRTDLSMFDITESGSGATIRVRDSKRASIPELSVAPLFTGVFVLAFCAFRRRR